MAGADYTTTAVIKAHAPGIQWSDTYDTVIPQLITRASEFVDRITRREIGAYNAPDSGEDRYFDGDGGLYQTIDECVAVSAVSMRIGSGTTTWTSLAATDYRTWPYNADADTGPIVRLDMDRRQGGYSQWPTGRHAVKVTARWGYSDSPPAVVTEAVIIQVVRWLKRGEQMFTDASLVAQAGRLVYAQKLDPDIEQLLFKSGLMKKKDFF